MLRLLIGSAVLLAGLVLAIAGSGTVGGVEEDLLRYYRELPGRLQQLLVGLVQLVALTLGVAVVVVQLVQRHFLRLLAVVVAAVVAGVGMSALQELLGVRVADVERGTIGLLADPRFPQSTYLASVTAAVAVLAPWLSRRWRRAAWSFVAVLVVLRVVASVDPALDTVLALGLGMVVGSLGLLLFGAPNPAPQAAELVGALRQAGVEPAAVRPLDGGQSSLLRYLATGADDRQVFVKVRTPDDRSADLLERLWRWVRLRSGEVDRPFGTLQQRVEHEALLTVAAHRSAARAPNLVGIGTTPGGSVVLVTEAVDGRSLAELDWAEVPDDLLLSLWHDAGALHDVGIAHRNLHADNVVVDDRRQAWIVDYDRARLAAPQRDRRRDLAELLVALSLLAGAERTVRTAVAALGPEVVAGVLPMLQPLALTSETRRQLRSQQGLLEELRRRVQETTGSGPVALERLQRLRPRTALALVAAAVAFYVLLPQLADVEQTLAAFSEAAWEWVPLLAAATVATFVFATISFVGAVAEPVPFVPALRAQVATAFAGRITPANTGGMALGVRFLQRSGIDTASASTAVGLNTLAGFLVHLVLLAAALVAGPESDVPGFSLPDSTVILGIIAVALAAIGVVLLLRPVRRAVVGPALKAIRTSARSLAQVFTTPTRVAALFGGSLGITLANGIALLAAVLAFGGGPTPLQVLIAYLVGSALGSVAPTPGGLGAVEAALVAGLTGFGMPSAEAVSAVLTYRLATFWLPIPFGWVAFTWMQRREEL